MNNKLIYSDFQFITHSAPGAGDELSQAREALEGGCRWIQLRMKESTMSEKLSMARAMRQLLDDYKDAVLIIDDHIDIAMLSGADGVHLGKNDLPVHEARKLVPPGFIIGATANTLEDVLEAVNEGADYIGLGPFRFTTTKQKLSAILGHEGYGKIFNYLHANKINIPLVAIGGITFDDLEALGKSGVRGVAVSGAIINASEPTAEAGRWIDKLTQLKNQ